MSINSDTFVGPSFSFADRRRRLLWKLVEKSIFRWVPVPLHQVRSWILRCFGSRIGRGVHVYPGVTIWAPWNLVIDDEAGVADGVTLYSQGTILIGKRAVISQGSYVCAGTHDYEKSGMPLVTKPIVIGEYAWVTAESFIHPGVTIGDGAVIGARSVVTRDMPAWNVCAGFPCKPLKLRVWRPNN